MLLMNLNENIDLKNNSFSFLHNFTVMSSLEGFSYDIHENRFITYQLFFDFLMQQLNK